MTDITLPRLFTKIHLWFIAFILLGGCFERTKTSTEGREEFIRMLDEVTESHLAVSPRPRPADYYRTQEISSDDLKKLRECLRRDSNNETTIAQKLSKDGDLILKSGDRTLATLNLFGDSAVVWNELYFSPSSEFNAIINTYRIKGEGRSTTSK